MYKYICVVCLKEKESQFKSTSICAECLTQLQHGTKVKIDDKTPKNNK